MLLRLPCGRETAIDDEFWRRELTYHAESAGYSISLRPCDVQWRAAPDRHTSYVTSRVVIEGEYRAISIHRLLLQCPVGFRVDHKDRDGLNNRLSNLRLATMSTNAMNSKKLPSKTGFRGVRFRQDTGKWKVQIELNGRKIHGGYHPTAEDAARKYDEMARELHGEFACLNFPSEAALASA